MTFDPRASGAPNTGGTTTEPFERVRGNSAPPPAGSSDGCDRELGPRLEAGNATAAPRGVARLASLGFSYGRREVFRDVDLRIDAGETIAIVGPSGCGKSTLLRVIAGLLGASTGAVEWARRSPTQHPFTISMMFQEDTLIPGRTIGENVALGLAFQGIRKSVRRRRAKELLDTVALADVIDFYPAQVSGGMRRRAQFVGSIATGPDVLLLDEPFSSLDEPTRVSIHQDVFQVLRERGMTTLLVTHDLGEAISMSDRVAVLSARPSTIAAVTNVPFGSDRDMFALRSEPRFLRAYGELWDELRAQIAMGETER